MSGVPDIGIGIIARSVTSQSAVVVKTASKELFPRLPIRITEHGITIEPAEPTVLGIPAPRPKKKS